MQLRRAQAPAGRLNGDPGTRRARQDGRTNLAPFGVLALIVPVLLALPACHRGGTARESVVLTVKVDPEPASVGMVTVEVSARDVSDQPVTGGVVKLEGNMSHPGMTPSTATCRETRPGVYSGPLELTMAGDWLIEAAASFPDGTSARKSVQLRGVRSR